MKKSLFKIVTLLTILAMVFTLVGCSGNKTPASNETSNDSATAKKSLKLGCLSTTEPALQWVKEGLKEQGYDVEVIMFDANQLPATALKDGDIDGVLANHKPWMETFNKENNADLAMVEPYYYYSFFAIYSAKYKSLDELPMNTQMAVPGDPTNLSRSLRILRDAGLITLGEKTGSFYTLLDIKDNPKNIKIVETDIIHTARSINDVDALISPAVYVAESGVVKADEFLYEDTENKKFPIGIITRSEDVNSEWANDIMTLLRTDEYRKKFDDHFQGKYVMFE
ncbi:MetQ/NlpA family ABC transporter substrate-binding protein [Proteiniborus sp.]|uniref:MetQ/NlpA family ABC transporter substrate-binding protein n=1 Tax=Proteiniborus sp. TaxID=2079015 RepID=UPI0033292AA3